MNLQNIAVLVNIIHNIFILIMIFGFMLPKKYLKFHALIWPLTLLHWKTNNNKCMLTQLEKYLKGDDSDSSDSSFMKSFFKRWGINLTMRGTNILNITLYTLGWLITMYRLLF